MTQSSTPDAPLRTWQLTLLRCYFELVRIGRKSVEVRVAYPRFQNLATGDFIRFICEDDDCLTRVVRVARYGAFEAMLDAEGPANVNPDVPRDEQLVQIRRIYGREKEALGVLAIGIELVSSGGTATMCRPR